MKNGLQIQQTLDQNNDGGISLRKPVMLKKMNPSSQDVLQKVKNLK